MNLNKVALLITKYEGKKKEVNIAQVKEILKVLIMLIKNDVAVLETIVSAAVKSKR